MSASSRSAGAGGVPVCRASVRGHRSLRAAQRCPACSTKGSPGAANVGGGGGDIRVEQAVLAQIAVIHHSYAHLLPRPDPHARTWDEVSRRLGRNDLPQALWDAHDEDRLVPRELRLGIGRAWTMAEWPEHSIGTEAWLELWDEALDLKTEYLLDAQAASRGELPERVKLFRAALPMYARGMAWTDDEDRALWFRDRLGGREAGMRLYTVQAQRLDVLARFRERGENEWVLDPGGIEPSVLER